MKIYKNEKGQLVIDGDGITTIQVPENVKGYMQTCEWIISRLIYTGNPADKSMEGKIMWNGEIVITGFNFTRV